MKGILTHTVVAIVAVLLTSLLMKQCSGVTTVTETVIQVDTVYTENVVEVRDTVYLTRWKAKYDTIVREVPVPLNTSPVQEGIYAYDEYYQDSSYRVSGNIMYQGVIEGHHQMFTKMKEELILLPTTRTVFKNRDVIKAVKSTQQPRFLAGAYLSGDEFTLQQAGVKLTFVDNKFRQYYVGKDVLNNRTWMFGADVPLFYSKFR